MRTALRIAVVVAVSLVAGRARAQEVPAKPADVAKFMGTWALSLDSPQGAFTMNFSLTDKDGKLAGELTSDVMPAQEVTDISKAGEDLVLKYAGNFQGNSFDARITLTPSGDNTVNLLFDINAGQFQMNGTGTKK